MPLLYHNNNSISNVTSFAQVPSGSPVLLSTATASASSSISFTSGIDSTYDIYKFEFINIHPATNDVNFTFNMSTDSGSNYNVTKTTTKFVALHTENDGTAVLEYEASNDLAQSTAYQILTKGLGNLGDENYSGDLSIFNPSSTTFVKHFLSTGNENRSDDATVNDFVAGYANTTSALTNIKFQMSSGNIDAGKILMFGIN